MKGKKRVLIVVGSFKFGGAERMAINVGQELSRNQFDVHYALQRPIFEIPHTISNENIHRLNTTIDRHKIVLHLKSFIGIFLLRLKLRPDFVIGFTYFSSFLSCFTLSRNIIGRFDINPYSINRKLRHRIATFVSRWPLTKYIIVPSHGIGDKLKTVNGGFRKKIHVIHNSIDLESIEKLSLENNLVLKENLQKPYLSAMGRLSHQKNYALLIKAFAQSKISKTTNLIIIGDGRLRNELERISEELGMSDKIYFTGFLSNPFPIIKGSEFFVNTSDFESFCNVILEALSLGVPVLATDCDFGPAEMIIQKKNGFLFQTGNQDELVTLLDQISLSTIDLEKLRINAKDSVEKFKLEQIGLQWVRLLERI